MSNEPSGVDAGHLGGLAAEQRAPGGGAGLGHPADDLGDDLGVELAGGDVVEEEQRAGRLHEHVADAVVDDVVAEPADAAERRRPARPWCRRRRWRRRAPDRSIAAIALAEKAPPKLPTPRTTSAPWVRSTASRIRATARLPSAMSTPAAA